MHEIHTVAVDDRGVCLSRGFAVQITAEQIDVLFVVHKRDLLDGGPHPPTGNRGVLIWFFQIMVLWPLVQTCKLSMTGVSFGILCTTVRHVI